MQAGSPSPDGPKIDHKLVDSQNTMNDHQNPINTIYCSLDEGKRQFRVLELHKGESADIMSATLHVQQLPWAMILRVREQIFQVRLLECVLENLIESKSKQGLLTFDGSLRATWWSIDKSYHWINLFLDALQNCTDCSSAWDWAKQVPLLMAVIEELLEGVNRVVAVAMSVSREGSSNAIDEALSWIRATYGKIETIGDDLKSPGRFLRKLSTFSSARLSSEGSSIIHPLPYSTISYCWQTVPSSSQILLNGELIHIPTSAHQVLHHLRSQSEARYLWIDAVCINQGDEIERASQVQLMGDIYGSAQETIAWLDQDYALAPNLIDDCFAVRYLNFFANFFPTTDSSPNLALVLDAFHEEFGKSQVEMTEGNLKPYVAKALGSIFERRYFSRVWIRQELFNSKEVTFLVKTKSIAFSRLLALVGWMFFDRDVLHHYPAIVSMDKSGYKPQNIHLLWAHSVYNNMPGKGGFLTLSMLATMTRTLDASNPRDKIYSLLAMSRWAKLNLPLPNTLRPDYSQSVMACMCNATKCMIEESGSLAVLDFQSLRSLAAKSCDDGTDPPWPKWCPRWDKSELPDWQAGFLSSPRDVCGVLKIDELQLRNVETPHVLCLRGIVVDFIQRTVSLSSLRIEKLDKNSLPLIQEHVFHGLELKSMPSIEMVPFMMSGRFRRYWTKEVREKIGRPVDGAHAAIDDLDNLNGSLAAVDVTERCQECVAFVTNGGRLGVGRIGLRSGDSIAILFGGRAVYALSQKDEIHHAWYGACSVDGILPGNFFDNPEKARDESIVFSIV